MHAMMIGSATNHRGVGLWLAQESVLNGSCATAGAVVLGAGPMHARRGQPVMWLPCVTVFRCAGVGRVDVRQMHASAMRSGEQNGQLVASLRTLDLEFT